MLDDGAVSVIDMRVGPLIATPPLHDVCPTSDAKGYLLEWRFSACKILSSNARAGVYAPSVAYMHQVLMED